MTGRERINRVFDGLPVDRPPLTSLADGVPTTMEAIHWKRETFLKYCSKE